MIKTLNLLYKPDIEEECKENVQNYFSSLYFLPDEQSSNKQKDFVYNAIKNFAEMNQKAY